MNSRLLSCVAVNTLLLLLLVAATGQDTCNYEGTEFQRGESLGDSFSTRCGSSDEFPCFCNPDLDPPVECPYCAHIILGGSLLCASDGETVGFIDRNGEEQTCACSAPSGAKPSSDCSVDPIVSSNNDICEIESTDGITQIFFRGESVASARPSRCGPEYPCFCDPDVEGQISCPYCVFPAFGGQLFCAEDGGNLSFRDENGVNRVCSCEISENGDPVSECRRTSATLPPEEPDSEPAADFCELELDNGDVLIFGRGESYGEFRQTRCGSSSDFPCFCNPDLPGQIYCPYCGFTNEDGELFCAKDDETISFTDGDSLQTCSCEIPTNELSPPITSCSEGEIPNTRAPGIVPSTTCRVQNEFGRFVEVDAGESFEELVDGPCGSGEEWPAFCNPGLAIARQTGGDEDFIEYPYCVFENTRSGEPACARSNGQVTFIDDNDVVQRCSCSYLGATFGGAQSICNSDTVDIPEDSEDSEDSASSFSFSSMQSATLVSTAGAAMWLFHTLEQL